MYRQILIHPDDRKYQRIVWRSNPADPVNHYELNTVTYGTGPASYLATKCLQVIAHSLKTTHPKASTAINSNFYMDDLMSGADTVEDALQLQQVVHSTLLSAGFPLRKYQSNSVDFLKGIDPSLIENLNTRLLGSESFIHVLGLIWCPRSDLFNVSLKLTVLPNVITKRIMLSDISRIFDVLGMLSPVTIQAKIFMQDLWREELGWDDPVSLELKSKFLSYRNDLELLSDYSVTRCYSILSNVIVRQLVGFCDASPKAYCAIVFMRTVDDQNNVSVSFVCAKTRVAPINTLTIPRLELQSAVLLSQLLCRLTNNLNIDMSNIFAFSDSKVVLSWFNCSTEQLKQFVRNRVVKILRFVPRDKWFYTESKSNPADLATRGISVNQFLQSTLWSDGPSWLINEFELFTSTNFNSLTNLPEFRKQRVSFNAVQYDNALVALKNYSSFDKCINVFSYIGRFVHNLRNTIKTVGLLTVVERNLGTNLLIRFSQLEFFSNEYNALVNKHSLSKRSKLLALNAFLDNNNIIRVGGRLSASNFSYNTKFPIVMSRNSRFIELYILYVHNRYYHASKLFLVNFVRTRFWVVGGLIPLVKKVVFQCVHCTRVRATTVQQLMADLPVERLSVSRPFTTTGVDLSGSYVMKCTNHRSTKYNKVYIAFFVCFVTRAVHIELVTSLSTESFILALERFISRRGLPKTIYSDNGTNFVGTKNVLEQSKLVKFATSNSITWKFIAPRSPHQGGLWESAVKSGKAYIFKAIGAQILNFDEFYTVLARVEAILNSRPIAYQTASSIVEPLTPGHFLVGSFLLDVPIDYDLSIKLSTRFRLIRAIIASFWTSWRNSYLNQLQIRNKWKQRCVNLKIDDVVVTNLPNTTVMDWPMGVVTATHPDKNGLVRVVDIKTATGTFRRSVQQLIKLPVEC